MSIAVDLALLGHDDERLRDVELLLLNAAKQRHSHTRSRLRTVPGSGELLSLGLRYEIHDIQRFPRVQALVSSCRLVTCAQEAAGQREGTAGTKIGNAYLQWAFSEAAVLFRRAHPAGPKYLGRLEKKHGPGQALAAVAPNLARAVYSLLPRHTAFDRHAFCTGKRSGAGEPGANALNARSHYVMERV